VRTNLEVFNAWTPATGPWSQWVKPALFASISIADIRLKNLPDLPLINWTPSLEKKFAAIIDLESDRALLEGIKLVECNFQPVPLYNCCQSPAMIVNVEPIVKTLIAGASYMQDKSFKQDVLPAFLLDSNRLLNSHIIGPGRFDNRWCVVPQDFPSGSMLLARGIQGILVRTNEVCNDLAHILKRYQKEGLEIKIANANSPDYKSFNMPNFFWFGDFWYRFMVMFKLRRNAAGGFGAIIPEANSSGMG